MKYYFFFCKIKHYSVTSSHKLGNLIDFFINTIINHCVTNILILTISAFHEGDKFHQK